MKWLHPGSDDTIINLKPRQIRACNSISISRNGLIAQGLDKVRGDNSLLIWDVLSETKTTDSKGNGIVISTPLQQLLPNEVVSSVEFIPGNSNLLLCGSYKFMREFDLRTGNTNFQCTGKSAYGIKVNPNNDAYFASYSEDGSFALWDRRYLQSTVIACEPALMFSRFFSEPSSRASKGNVSFRFSKSRAEEFAILQGGDTLRRWQLGVVPGSDSAESSSGRANRLLSGNQKQGYFSKNGSLFTSCVLDSKTDFDKVVSFDYAPKMSSHSTADFMCIRQNGQVFRMEVIESPDATVFDPYNNIAIAEPDGVTVLGPQAPVAAAPKSPNESEEDEASLKEVKKISKTLSAFLLDEEDDSDDEIEDSIPVEGVLDYQKLLNNDISMTMRHRALAGYGTDGAANFEIIASSNQEKSKVALRYIWRWLDHSLKNRDNGSAVYGCFDLGLEGVNGLWEGMSSKELVKRVSKSGMRKVSELDYLQAIDHMNSLDGKRVFVSSKIMGSTKDTTRQLCLKSIGWDFELQELEERLKELESRGRHAQAAGWALFHGDVDRCVTALASSRKERLRLMSTAVAGYHAYKDSTTNNLWREQCQRLATDLDEPYLRAIFAYITYGSWDDVLDEGSLPLTERLGIALRFLPDDRLAKFLSQSTERAIKSGDLEGISLTGLTSRVTDLLQVYIDKTSDVQTAALISILGCPRYFEDVRVQNWASDYRILLNHWGLFNIRAKFDISKSKFSVDRYGVQLGQKVPHQIFLRCFQCHGVIGKPSGSNHLSMAAKASRQMTGYPHKEHLSMRCPHCNYPLPRCAICLLPLGSMAPAFEKTSADDYLLFDRWPTYCLSCNHGLHAGHAKKWFEKYNICPVPDCNCSCNKK